ncbi:hypothetical protein HELRODRAFT_174170 [Helobdella robusta]|uniref:Ig-like domain-containing protein n=1 Tax=Helobdella robusta TaxID=6412 RepID=T1F7Q5_HELRO|nr:hypothetical protein HELRODRAFT_174170 [Helobdella robusta]ESO02763.1 hypothetical protein HELRODRAFT_174170 [Helobdella robusta]
MFDAYKTFAYKFKAVSSNFLHHFNVSYCSGGSEEQLYPRLLTSGWIVAARNSRHGPSDQLHPPSRHPSLSTNNINYKNIDINYISNINNNVNNNNNNNNNVNKINKINYIINNIDNTINNNINNKNMTNNNNINYIFILLMVASTLHAANTPRPPNVPTLRADDPPFPPVNKHLHFRDETFLNTTSRPKVLITNTTIRMTIVIIIITPNEIVIIITPNEIVIIISTPNDDDNVIEKLEALHSSGLGTATKKTGMFLVITGCPITALSNFYSHSETIIISAKDEVYMRIRADDEGNEMKKSAGDRMTKYPPPEHLPLSSLINEVSHINSYKRHDTDVNTDHVTFSDDDNNQSSDNIEISFQPMKKHSATSPRADMEGFHGMNIDFMVNKSRKDKRFSPKTVVDSKYKSHIIDGDTLKGLQSFSRKLVKHHGKRHTTDMLMTIEPSNFHVVDGSSAVLFCRIYDNNNHRLISSVNKNKNSNADHHLPYNVTWRKDDKLLPSKQRIFVNKILPTVAKFKENQDFKDSSRFFFLGSVLRISPVKLQKDVGSYKCTLEFDQHSILSSTAHLNVYDEDARESSNFKFFNCTGMSARNNFSRLLFT